MKKSLLRIVQLLLTSTESESVTSIDQTEEASMCVDIINQSYEDMMVSKKWKHLKNVEVLEAHTFLNQLKATDGAISIDPYNLYYNNRPVQYYSPEEFLRFTIGRSGATVMDGYNIFTDRQPSFFTSDDDQILMFDSVPSPISGLDASLSKAFVYRIPTSELAANDDVFDMPAQLFPTLIKLCEANAVLKLKSDSNAYDRLHKDFLKSITALERTKKFIDVKEDLRTNIPARPSRRSRMSIVEISN